MRTRTLVAALALTLVGTAAQAQWQALPDVAPAPADNPTTAAKVELGKYEGAIGASGRAE